MQIEKKKKSAVNSFGNYVAPIDSVWVSFEWKS